MLRRIRKESSCKSSVPNGGRGSLYDAMYTACILGFFYLLQISELEALTWEDITADTHDVHRFFPIRIKRSNTDIFRDGVVRYLVEIDTVRFPVNAFWHARS